jgi:hypothetical protein
VEFEREIADGRLPMPVKLGNHEHWSRAKLDAALDTLAGTGEQWFKGSPLFRDVA